jgi:hypothetical protein
MRIVPSLVLVLTLGGQAAQEKPQPGRPGVPVLKAEAVIGNALKQVKSASPEPGFDAPTPVMTLEAGLLYVPNTADRPILAMAECEGWFFYATAVARDGQTGLPVSMISGYAIKRGGRRVVEWSVW